MTAPTPEAARLRKEYADAAKKIAQPWIDGAIKRGNPNHVARLTFAEWLAAFDLLFERP